MNDEKQTFYATFGFSQSLSRNYVKFEAEDKAEAHRIMFQTYGQKWAFLYPEVDYERAVARYGLAEVPFGTPNERLSDD